MALAINNTGQIVGWSGTSTGAVHGFFWSSNIGMTDLVALSGWPNANASAVNDIGDVVGLVYDGLGHDLAVRWSRDHSSVVDLNTLMPAFSGWTLTSALGVNNTGQIVGHGTHNGQERAFLLTPQ